MRRDDFTDVTEVECLQETAAALLCRSPLWDGEKVWIPKSVVSDDSEVQAKGDLGTLLFELWFAEKENLV